MRRRTRIANVTARDSDGRRAPTKTSTNAKIAAPMTTFATLPRPPRTQIAKARYVYPPPSVGSNGTIMESSEPAAPAMPAPIANVAA